MSPPTLNVNVVKGSTMGRSSNITPSYFSIQEVSITVQPTPIVRRILALIHLGAHLNPVWENSETVTKSDERNMGVCFFVAPGKLTCPCQ